MNLCEVWAITNTISDICEIASSLRDDPTYTREEAAKALEQLIEKHLDPMYQKAMQVPE